MTPSEEIQQCLKAGNLTAAIAANKAAIRKAPIDGELRFMLFQTLSLVGDWEGASNQLVAYSELVGRQSPLPILFNDVIRAEVRRKHVFLGEEQPLIFGEPPDWMSYMVQSLSHASKGEYVEAAELRTQAMERVPAASGTINGASFEWLMDGDSRVSPFFEVIIHGSYYWIPHARVRSVTIEPPAQARDVIWAASTLTLENEGVISAFIPVRYPGAGSWKSDALKLARQTEWEVPHEGFYLGLGQRVLMTSDAELPLLEIRQIEFNKS